jgi:hypothetical protein
MGAIGFRRIEVVPFQNMGAIGFRPIEIVPFQSVGAISGPSFRG